MENCSPYNTLALSCTFRHVVPTECSGEWIRWCMKEYFLLDMWLQNKIHFSLLSIYMSFPLRDWKNLHWFLLVRWVLWWPIRAWCPSKYMSAAGDSGQVALMNSFIFNFKSLSSFWILSVICDKLVSLAFLLLDKDVFLILCVLPLFSPCISWLFTKFFYKRMVSYLHRTSLVLLFYTSFCNT